MFVCSCFIVYIFYILHTVYHLLFFIYISCLFTLIHIFLFCWLLFSDITSNLKVDFLLIYILLPPPRNLYFLAQILYHWPNWEIPQFGLKISAPNWEIGRKWGGRNIPNLVNLGSHHDRLDPLHKESSFWFDKYDGTRDTNKYQ